MTTADLKALRETQILDVYAVSANAESGEWIGEPEATGRTTSAWDWAQMQDTDTTAHDTYVYDATTQSERAIIITWT